jgi:UDP-N-acetylglucosamine 3-dehydrogenase
MMKLKAGLIGLGDIGMHHARILSTLDGVEFVGSCDPDSNRVTFGQGKPVYKNLKELLSHNLDYAVVAVPANNHLEVSTHLARNGVHALIEKPLAHNSTDAKQIVETFRKESLIGAVGHIEIFNSVLREAKSLLGQLGTIHIVSTQRSGPFPKRLKDIGVVMDLAIHDIHLTSWLTGQDYASVSAQILHRLSGEYEDMVIAIGKLSDGSLVNHIIDWLSPKKTRKVSITGANGAFEIDILGGSLTFSKAGFTVSEWQEIRRLKGDREGNETKISISQKEPLLQEHQNFRDVIFGKLEMEEIVSLNKGLQAVLIAERILGSARNNLDTSGS